ncbi:MAG: YheO domain protein [Firmicutes bacterium]|nr:YheO domain protein [Bacillota bacterium]
MDKEMAFDFLTRLAGGLAQIFGSSCETVVHDMNNPKASILYICNGEVTKRKVGDSITVAGIKGVVNDYNEREDHINLLGKTSDGRLIKNSTFHLEGDDFHYAITINFDFTHLSLAKSALAELTSVGQIIADASNSSGNLLQDIFDECLNSIGKPVAMFTKEDRLRMIAMLLDRGAFKFSKSVAIVAEKLNISRYTIYKYLRKRELS